MRSCCFSEETPAVVQAGSDVHSGQAISRGGEKVTDHGSVLKERLCPSSLTW